MYFQLIIFLFRSEANKYKILNLDVDSDSSKFLTSMPSPLLSDSSSSTKSSTFGSTQNLVKRSSIDSGINMSCGPASETYRFKNSKFSGLRDSPKFTK